LVISKKLALGYSICIFPEVSYEDDTVFLNPFKRGAFKIAIDHQLPVVPMVFYDCKRKHPWYPEIFQEEVRDVVEKGLKEDPKRRQYAAVEIEKLIAQKA